VGDLLRLLKKNQGYSLPGIYSDDDRKAAALRDTKSGIKMWSSAHAGAQDSPSKQG
jgi:hypothetical protein